jgi:hypothetical protein
MGEAVITAEAERSNERANEARSSARTEQIELRVRREVTGIGVVLPRSNACTVASDTPAALAKSDCDQLTRDLAGRQVSGVIAINPAQK